MAVPFSNTSLRVPRGFQNLLEGLAREVLREQPRGEQEIYEFAAKYFDRLLKVREAGGGADPAQIGAAHEDLMYNGETLIAAERRAKEEEAEEEIDIDLDDPKTGEAALKIQANFRGYKTRKSMKDDPPPEPHVPTAAPEEEEEEEELPDLNDAGVQDATLKIQAGFRGFKARKSMKEQSMAEAPAPPPPPPQEEEEEELPDLEAKDVQEATLKIQAGFRGFKARKALKTGESEGAGGETEAGESAPEETVPGEGAS